MILRISHSKNGGSKNKSQKKSGGQVNPPRNFQHRDVSFDISMQRCGELDCCSH